LLEAAKERPSLNGIIHIIDEIQDFAADNLYSEETVFGSEEDRA